MPAHVKGMLHEAVFAATCNALSNVIQNNNHMEIARCFALYSVDIIFTYSHKK